MSDGEFVFEVDGYGSRYFMDDGTVPSLLSLPYLGCVGVEDAVYAKTRKRVLSTQGNAYYFEGVSGSGIGSPHTQADWVWPMGLILQAMTSDEDAEITRLLDMLKSTTADTMLMHESFYKNDPRQYTRSWFAWCNNLFGDLILTLMQQRPWLVM